MSADDIPAPAPIMRKVQPINLAAFPPSQPDPCARCLKESRDLLRDLELSQEWSAEMREAISDAIHNADNALAALSK